MHAIALSLGTLVGASEIATTERATRFQSGAGAVHGLLSTLPFQGRLLQVTACFVYPGSGKWIVHKRAAVSPVQRSD